MRWRKGNGFGAGVSQACGLKKRMTMKMKTMVAMMMLLVPFWTQAELQRGVAQLQGGVLHERRHSV